MMELATVGNWTPSTISPTLHEEKQTSVGQTDLIENSYFSKVYLEIFYN